MLLKNSWYQHQHVCRSILTHIKVFVYIKSKINVDICAHLLMKIAKDKAFKRLIKL